MVCFILFESSAESSGARVESSDRARGVLWEGSRTQIGALKLEYPTLDFSYRDFPLGEPGDKMFTWPGPPDEDVMIVVHQCSGVRELFHRHDFFYFNYTTAAPTTL